MAKTESSWATKVREKKKKKKSGAAAQFRSRGFSGCTWPGLPFFFFFFFEIGYQCNQEATAAMAGRRKVISNIG